MGRGEDPQVLVTVAKKALCSLTRQSLKERKTITSIFSIYAPRVQQHFSQSWMIISLAKQKLQFNDAKKRLTCEKEAKVGLFLPIAWTTRSSCKNKNATPKLAKPRNDTCTHEFLSVFWLLALKIHPHMIKIFSLAVILVLPLAARAEWEKLDETPLAVIYIDHERIAKNAQFPTVWFLSDFKSKNKRGVLSTQVLSEFNCGDKQRRTIAFTSHEKNMAAGKPIFKSLQAGSWRSITEDSVANKMMHLACEP